MKNRIRLLAQMIAALFLLMTFVEAGAEVFDLIVNPGGNGDFTTVSDAIAAVPANSDSRTIIFVYPGIYEEKIILPPTAINVSLIGEDPEKVIISWDDYAGKDGMSSAETYTFWADADDFYAENISFVNTAGPVGQALAIRTTGDRMAFRNCWFLGHQDTYYAHKRRQYNVNCFIEGTTDFIYGDATCVFEQCTIQCKKGGSYITAPADTKLVSSTPEGKFYHGLLFRDCNVRADEGVPSGSYYLGRPWQPDASSVFIQCTLGAHIKAAGWSTWSGNNHLSGCFAEYRNTDPQGNLVDTTLRVDWSKQLSESEVVNYYNLEYFLNKPGDAWNPIPVTTSPITPTGLSSDGFSLTWNGTDSVAGYMIYRNDTLLGFSVENMFSYDNMPPGGNEFQVKSVSSTGALSKKSQTLKVFGPLDARRISMHPSEPVILGNLLSLPETGDIWIYDLSGRLMDQASDVRSMDMMGLKTGIYLVKFKNEREKVSVHKILISNNRN